MNLNLTSPKNYRSHFLGAILDIQDGCHSSVTLAYNRTFLIIKNIGSGTKFVIVCNLERSICGIFNLEPAFFKMVAYNGVEGWEKLNPNIFGLFQPQLGQKGNKINFGNKNGKNDITHQTIPPADLWRRVTSPRHRGARLRDNDDEL